MAARSRLRVDTRKWALSKLAPKKYGDKVTSVLEGGERPVEFSGMSEDQLRAWIVKEARALACLIHQKDSVAYTKPSRTSGQPHSP